MSRRGLRLDIGHGVSAAFVANQQRVALSEIAGVRRLAMGGHEAAIGVVGAAGGDALGDDAARGVFAEMDHLGAGIDLLEAVGYRDRIEFAARIIAAQNAAWIFPGDGGAGLDLGPGNLGVAAAAVAALGHKIVNTTPTLLVAGIPVLHRRVFDLGVFQSDQFNDRGMKLVFVAHGGSAAFEIAHIGALIGDDQSALELAGLLLVYAEIGGKLHRATGVLRHIDERAVGEDRGIERGIKIVALRYHAAEIFADKLWMLANSLGHGAKDHPGTRKLFLEGGDDGHRIEHRIDSDPGAFDAGQHFALAQRNTEFLIGAQQLGIDLIEALRRRMALWRGIVIEILEIDFRVGDARPLGLGHGEPVPIGFKAPCEHPFGLALLARNEDDDLLGEALGGLFGFDIGREAVFVLIDVDIL